jgi:hypothetical protein
MQTEDSARHAREQFDIVGGDARADQPAASNFVGDDDLLGVVTVEFRGDIGERRVVEKP